MPGYDELSDLGTGFACETLLSLDQVCYRTSLSTDQIYKRMKLGTFPLAIRIGTVRSTGRAGRVAWVASEVDAWVREQIRVFREGESAQERKSA